MARTVDTSSTFENWRQTYNDLANDVGSLGSLTTANKTSIVNAINYIMDQYFFFQDFDFNGSQGETSNTVFSGNDSGGNALSYSVGKLLVFKNGALLRNGTDYTASNGTSVVLASSANNSDVIRISAFTGSYEGVGTTSTTGGSDQWQAAGGILYNKNTGGIIFNADGTITNSLDVGNSLQFENVAYFKDEVYLKSVSSSQSSIRFQDQDNSAYIGLSSPDTISSSFTLKLPSADGSNTHVLTTDGSGNLSFAAPTMGTAPDITISANNSANETVYPVFVDGATGAQGLESDTGLTYNPSTGLLSTTLLAGTVSTATQNTITTMTGLVTVGTIGTGTWQGTAIARAYIANDAIDGTKIEDDAIDSEHYAAHSIDNAHISDNVVNADLLDVTGNGTTSQFLRSDGDGSFTWATPTGDITGVTAGTGLSGGGSSGDVSLALDFAELTDMTGNISSGTEFIIQDGSTESRKAASEIQLSHFSNNSGWTSNTGTLTPTGTVNANEYARFTGATTLEARTAAEVRSDLNVADGATANTGTVDTSGSPEDNEFAKFTDSNTIEGRSYGEVRTDLNVADGANAYVHPTSAGNKHIPAGGSSGQYLKYSSAGTAVWAADTTYTAGDGVGLSGTEFSVAVNASGGSNLTQDSNGVSLTATPTFTTVTATGDITANTSSDMALKENIINIPNPLEKISKIGGYMFDWKDHGYEDVHGRGHDTGIIAQEIEEILPEIVNTRESGIKAVNYMKLIPLLVESIKELKTELDELKSSNS